MSGVDPRVQVLLESGRYDLAEREARRAIGERPTSAEAWYGLAAALHGQDKAADAEEAARESLRQDADHLPSMVILARVQSSRDQHDAALKTATALVGAAPSAPEVWMTMAVVQAGRRDISAALEAVDRALGLDPEDAEAHTLRGFLLQRLGRIDEAGDSSDAALRREPNDPRALAVRGWALMHEGKYADAQVLFRDALSRDPELEFAREGLLATLRVRFLPYRLMMRWQLWGMRTSRNHMFMVFAGIFVVGQVLRRSLDADGPLRWVMLVPYVALVAFVFMTWVGEAMANATLRLHPFGRLVLRNEERRVSDGLLVSLVVAAGAALVGAFIDRAWLPVAMSGLIGAVVLVRTIGLFYAGNRVHLPVGLTLWVLLIGGSIGMALLPPSEEMSDGMTMLSLPISFSWLAGLIGSVGYILVGSLSSLGHGRRG